MTELLNYRTEHNEPNGGNLRVQEINQEILSSSKNISLEAKNELRQILINMKIEMSEIEINNFADYILTIVKHSIKI
jgi:hypothetical protein